MHACLASVSGRYILTPTRRRQSGKATKPTGVEYAGAPVSAVGSSRPLNFRRLRATVRRTIDCGAPRSKSRRDISRIPAPQPLTPPVPPDISRIPCRSSPRLDPKCVRSSGTRSWTSFPPRIRWLRHCNAIRRMSVDQPVPGRAVCTLLPHAATCRPRPWVVCTWCADSSIGMDRSTRERGNGKLVRAFNGTTIIIETPERLWRG